MKRKSPSVILAVIGIGLFLAIFCSMLVFTGAFVGIGYALQSAAKGTQVSGYSLAMNTVAPLSTEESQVETETEVQATEKPAEVPQATNTEAPTQEAPVNEPTNTPTMAFTATMTPSPMPPTITPTPTLDATSMASDMRQEVQTLFDSGILTSTEGTYYQLPNFNKSWNQLGVYDQTPTDFYDLKNFVLRADASWQVDGNSGDWRESGCGIVFREDKDQNHYLVYYSLDGRARLIRNLQGSPFLLGRTTIYDVDRQNGYGKIMIVVEGDYINIYFNEKEIFRKRDTWLQRGALSFTVVSGNMNGYGTQCNLTNVELWEIAE